jgi:pantoate--beta-alanine ligase
MEITGRRLNGSGAGRNVLKSQKRVFVQIIDKIKDLREALSLYRMKGNSIGFVPTMGALHDGHLSLVRKSKEQTLKTIVSIFVNPTQFTNAVDLKNYPRTIERDLEKLKRANVDLVFAPSVEEIYSGGNDNAEEQFDFGNLENVMEGKSRRGHFRGVAQVVSKLFEIVQPNKAYFGEKDYQQLAVIRQLVKQKNYAVEIVAGHTVREDDGLAMSSRNVLLTKDDRKEASNISRALFFVRDNFNHYTVEKLKKKATEIIEEGSRLKVEYIEIADDESLQPVKSRNEAVHARVFAAVKAVQSGIRLIDNVALNATFAA